MSVTSGCCVFTDRSFWVGLIIRPEEYYPVCVCDRDVSIMRRPWPLGAIAPGKGTFVFKEREPSSSSARMNLDVTVSAFSSFSFIIKLKNADERGQTACFLVSNKLHYIPNITCYAD
jgi:hypothetical protein